VSDFIWRVGTQESAMTYVNWCPGQPDSGAQMEACVHLWSDESYTWNNAPCTYTACYVCEIDV